jgi:5-methyltetrahydrofolate--homocysteine methyltransferase
MEDIYQAVLEGRVDDVAGLVESALASGVSAEEILNRAMITAMDLVGKKFGDGEYFIPQVLWSAKAMQAGMDLLRPLFADSADSDRGKVIIGTARGDIHDIGKNLVGMMLEGAGFNVVDLGVDVDPVKFVETAVAENGRVIAVSALLTTTMPAMQDVVNLVRERGLDTKVIIGGAPVDETFREEIGADGYGIDAVDAVRKVRELLAA